MKIHWLFIFQHKHVFLIIKRVQKLKNVVRLLPIFGKEFVCYPKKSEQQIISFLSEVPKYYTMCALNISVTNNAIGTSAKTI